MFQIFVNVLILLLSTTPADGPFEFFGMKDQECPSERSITLDSKAYGFGYDDSSFEEDFGGKDFTFKDVASSDGLDFNYARESKKLDAYLVCAEFRANNALPLTEIFKMSEASEALPEVKPTREGCFEDVEEAESYDLNGKLCKFTSKDEFSKPRELVPIPDGSFPATLFLDESGQRFGVQAKGIRFVKR